MSEPKTPSPLLKFALQLAGVAAQEILPRFQKTGVEHKLDGTPVTEADREAENAMRGMILDTYPDHGIIGEEHDEIEGSSEYTWILDPIDGTVSFALGLPSFGTLVALLKNGHPVIGVINMPALKETVYAEMGYGCWLLDKDGELTRQHVSDPAKHLEDAFVSTTGVYNTNIDPSGSASPFNMIQLIRSSGKFEFVGDCVQHALVARGLIDAAFDPEMSPWDNAAIIPCILEAGGSISTGTGRTDNLVFAESLLSSSDPSLHREILEVINPD